MTHTATDDPFRVDPWNHYLGGFVARHPGLWRRLGNLETRLLGDSLAEVRVEAPIYVAGLARSGSTLLLEVLSWHQAVATHRYRDYPLLHTPYLWNRFLDFAPRAEAQPAERTHKDGIMVTPESPEAFEEVLWMAFFPQLHSPATSAVLDEETSHPAFEAFYRDHIRKLLRVRGAERYVSKGNYNVTRLEYLLKCFPDARFIIPVRDPVWHIASLMKQQRLFHEGQLRQPRAVTHLQRVGHFEFGLDRRPINVGDDGEAREIAALWQRGHEVEGWAHYWRVVHDYLADRLDANPALRAAALVVHYEPLCAQPQETLSRLLEHCDLQASPDLLERARSHIRHPSYYRPHFSERELATIEHWTRQTAERLGMTSAAKQRMSAGQS